MPLIADGGIVVRFTGGEDARHLLALKGQCGAVNDLRLLQLAGWVVVDPSTVIAELEEGLNQLELLERAHHIIRRDYYIECTCRYKGPALHGKCPKCGTDRLPLPYPAFDW